METIKNMKRITIMNYVLCALFIILGVVSRLITHVPNFTPILSIALLSGLYIKNRFIVLIPISIMLVSDLFIGSHITAPWVYFSILIICMIGYLIKNNISNVFFYSILSSIVFFIISNFGVWFSGGYTYSLEGLVVCYIAAIPFFKNTLMSTVFFSFLIHALNAAIVRYCLPKNESNKILEH